MKTKALKQLFDKHINPGAVQKILNRKPAAELKRTHFQFVVVQIRDTDNAMIQRLAGDVAETFLGCDVVLGDLLSSLIVGYLGTPDTSKDSRTQRHRVVTLLLEKLGGNVRIVHGECYGWVGLLGAKDIWRYATVVPDLTNVLQLLLSTSFGNGSDMDRTR